MKIYRPWLITRKNEILNTNEIDSCLDGYEHFSNIIIKKINIEISQDDDLWTHKQFPSMIRGYLK